MAVETPHFAHPFSFATKPNGVKFVAVDEQHSEDEIVGCILRTIAYERGYRDELPDFGVTDPTFSQSPVDGSRLVTEIEEWEDRADLTGIVSIDSADELTERIRIAVSAGEAT